MFWYIFGSINGVAEMKNLNINIKSNHRKLCQQRKQQSFIKHFNVLPVIGHFFSSFFENFHDIPLLCKTYQWNIEKITFETFEASNYIWMTFARVTNVTCGALGIETDWAEKVLDSASW